MGLGSERYITPEKSSNNSPMKPQKDYAQTLKESQVTLDDDITEDIPCFTIGELVFTLCNFSLVTGKAKARKKKIFKLAKGYWGRRKNVWTIAKNAVEKALSYSYRDRKVRKREFRKLWIQRINAAARQRGLSYSVFMSKLKAQGLDLNRKVLADIAMNNPKSFDAVFNKICS